MWLCGSYRVRNMISAPPEIMLIRSLSLSRGSITQIRSILPLSQDRVNKIPFFIFRVHINKIPVLFQGSHQYDSCLKTGIKSKISVSISRAYQYDPYRPPGIISTWSLSLSEDHINMISLFIHSYHQTPFKLAAKATSGVLDTFFARGKKEPRNQGGLCSILDLYMKYLLGQIWAPLALLF